MKLEPCRVLNFDTEGSYGVNISNQDTESIYQIKKSFKCTNINTAVSSPKVALLSAVNTLQGSVNSAVSYFNQKTFHQKGELVWRRFYVKFLESALRSPVFFTGFSQQFRKNLKHAKEIVFKKENGRVDGNFVEFRPMAAPIRLPYKNLEICYPVSLSLMLTLTSNFQRRSEEVPGLERSLGRNKRLLKNRVTVRAKSFDKKLVTNTTHKDQWDSVSNHFLDYFFSSSLEKKRSIGDSFVKRYANIYVRRMSIWERISTKLTKKNLITKFHPNKKTSVCLFQTKYTRNFNGYSIEKKSTRSIAPSVTFYFSSLNRKTLSTGVLYSKGHSERLENLRVTLPGNVGESPSWVGKDLHLSLSKRSSNSEISKNTTKRLQRSYQKNFENRYPYHVNRYTTYLSSLTNTIQKNYGEKGSKPVHKIDMSALTTAGVIPSRLETSHIVPAINGVKTGGKAVHQLLTPKVNQMAIRLEGSKPSSYLTSLPFSESRVSSNPRLLDINRVYGNKDVNLGLPLTSAENKKDGKANHQLMTPGVNATNYQVDTIDLLRPSPPEGGKEENKEGNSQHGLERNSYLSSLPFSLTPYESQSKVSKNQRLLDRTVFTSVESTTVPVDTTSLYGMEMYSSVVGNKDDRKIDSGFSFWNKTWNPEKIISTDLSSFLKNEKRTRFNPLTTQGKKESFLGEFNKFHTFPIFSTFVYKEWLHRFSFLEYFLWSARKTDLALPFYTHKGVCHIARRTSINLIKNRLDTEGIFKEDMPLFTSVSTKGTGQVEVPHLLQLRNKKAVLVLDEKSTNVNTSVSKNFTECHSIIRCVHQDFELTKKLSFLFRQMNKTFFWNSSRSFQSETLKSCTNVNTAVSSSKRPSVSSNLLLQPELRSNPFLPTLGVKVSSHTDVSASLFGHPYTDSTETKNIYQVFTNSWPSEITRRTKAASNQQATFSLEEKIDDTQVFTPIGNEVNHGVDTSVDTQQFPRLVELLHFTGGSALRNLLARFNLILLGKFLRHELKNLELKVNYLLALKVLTYSQGLLLGKLAKRRSKQIRRLKLLEVFQSQKNNPEWMILSVLPVLPPDLRPILRVNDDFVVASDLNRLYQTVLRRNNTIHERLDDPLPCPESGLFRQRSLQKAVDGLLENGKGGGTPLCASKRRPLVSLSHVLKGKKGLFRQHLLGKRVDYSGRSVIVVGPKLNLHECGLPKEMALELFQPFLIHRLKIKGLAISNTAARRMIQQEDSAIWQIVKQLVYEHPVLLNRAPTLHRLGIQAFQPKLVSGRAILLHPLVCNGFNADFDGDQMAVHVPLSFQARAEAWKIMWSKNNLLSPATGQPILVPSQDMVLGCYYLSVFVPRILQYQQNWTSLSMPPTKLLTLTPSLQGRSEGSKEDTKYLRQVGLEQSSYLNRVQVSSNQRLIDDHQNLSSSNGSYKPYPPEGGKDGGTTMAAWFPVVMSKDRFALLTSGFRDKISRKHGKKFWNDRCFLYKSYVNWNLLSKHFGYENSVNRFFGVSSIKTKTKKDKKRPQFSFFQQLKSKKLNSSLLINPLGFFKKTQHLGFLNDVILLQSMTTMHLMQTCQNTLQSPHSDTFPLSSLNGTSLETLATPFASRSFLAPIDIKNVSSAKGRYQVEIDRSPVALTPDPSGVKGLAACHGLLTPEGLQENSDWNQRVLDANSFMPVSIVNRVSFSKFAFKPYKKATTFNKTHGNLAKFSFHYFLKMSSCCTNFKRFHFVVIDVTGIKEKLVLANEIDVEKCEFFVKPHKNHAKDWFSFFNLETCYNGETKQGDQTLLTPLMLAVVTTHQVASTQSLILQFTPLQFSYLYKCFTLSNNIVTNRLTTFFCSKKLITDKINKENNERDTGNIQDTEGLHQVKIDFNATRFKVFNERANYTDQHIVATPHLKRGHYFSSLQDSLMAYSQGRLQTHTPFWARVDITHIGVDQRKKQLYTQVFTPVDSEANHEVENKVNHELLTLKPDPEGVKADQYGIEAQGLTLVDTDGIYAIDAPDLNTFVSNNQRLQPEIFWGNDLFNESQDSKGLYKGASMDNSSRFNLAKERNFDQEGGKKNKKFFFRQAHINPTNDDQNSFSSTPVVYASKRFAWKDLGFYSAGINTYRKVAKMPQSREVLSNSSEFALFQLRYGFSQELCKILFKKKNGKTIIETNDIVEAPLELRISADGNLVQLFTTFQNHYNCSATTLDQCKENCIRYMRTTAGRVVINEALFQF